MRPNPHCVTSGWVTGKNSHFWAEVSYWKHEELGQKIWMVPHGSKLIPYISTYLNTGNLEWKSECFPYSRECSHSCCWETTQGDNTTSHRDTLVRAGTASQPGQVECTERGKKHSWKQSSSLQAYSSPFCSSFACTNLYGNCLSTTDSCVNALGQAELWFSQLSNTSIPAWARFSEIIKVCNFCKAPNPVSVYCMCSKWLAPCLTLPYYSEKNMVGLLEKVVKRSKIQNHWRDKDNNTECLMVPPKKFSTLLEFSLNVP